MVRIESNSKGIFMYMDQAEIDKVDKALGELWRSTPRVIARAANRSVGKARKIVKQETADYYDTLQKEVEQGFKLTKANVAKPYARLTYDSPYVNLYKWHGRRMLVLPRKAHQTHDKKPKWYKAHVKKGQANEPLNKVYKKYPFVQVSKKTGRPALFVRTNADLHKRYPIMGVAGPAMTQGIKQPGVMDKIEKQVMDEFEKRLEHEIDAVLKGYAK